MLQALCFFLVIVCLYSFVPSARADFDYQVNLSGGYIGNLYLDSTNLEDSYSTTNALVRYYPISQTEVELSGAYTYYSLTYGLSNFLYSGKVTVIPIHEDSPFSVYLSGAYDNVSYRKVSESNNNHSFRWIGSLGYRPASFVNLRAGTRLTGTQYPNSLTVDADHEKYEFFAGVNLSLFGTNSFDIEVGTGRMNFAFIDSSVQAVPPIGSPADSMSGGHLQSYFISPRFSRSVGAKTGVSITYTYRKFTNPDEVIIFGYGTEFLSPWASVYEGSSVMLSIKSYIVPHLVISTGSGYWEKTYLKSLKRHPIFGFGTPKDAPRRHDFYSRSYVSVQRPIRIATSGILEPIVILDYAKNNSTSMNDEQFDYTSTTISAAITYRR